MCQYNASISESRRLAPLCKEDFPMVRNRHFHGPYTYGGGFAYKLNLHFIHQYKFDTYFLTKNTIF